MQDRHVLLVSDRRERAERLARGIALILPCRVIAPGAALPAGRSLGVVLDVAADWNEDTLWSRDLAARIRRGGEPCLYLSRGDSAQDAAAARIFSNLTVVPARAQSSVIATLVRLVEEARRTGPGSGSGGAPRGAPRAATAAVRRPEIRVERATTLVTGLFDDATRGAPPRTADADEGTEIVLETISEVGIRGWLDLVWRHDISVYQHSLSVAGYAAAFAAELGFGRGDRRRLAKAALLHDVGKALIPTAILNKPGPLTPDETRVMQTHADLGADLLERAGTFEPEVVEVARLHHERLDGSGYTRSMTGEAISDLVRLVAICDVHSALTERRVYRPPMSSVQALAIMDRQAGQLDPDLLRAYRPIVARSDSAVALAVGHA